MKIKRYTAASMRAALALVRAEQGPDAVILSSRRSEEGIEVIAAVDYDEALFVEARLRAPPRSWRPRGRHAPPAPIEPPAANRAPAPQNGRRGAGAARRPPSTAAPPAPSPQAAPRPCFSPPPLTGTARCSANCRTCAACSRPALPA